MLHKKDINNKWTICLFSRIWQIVHFLKCSTPHLTGGLHTHKCLWDLF